MQNHETTPKYVGYDENKLQETKTTESKRISKVDAKQTRLFAIKYHQLFFPCVARMNKESL
jgi:hypothetical protein